MNLSAADSGELERIRHNSANHQSRLLTPVTDLSARSPNAATGVSGEMVSV
jgi:hypothetical protein